MVKSTDFPQKAGERRTLRQSSTGNHKRFRCAGSYNAGEFTRRIGSCLKGRAIAQAGLRDDRPCCAGKASEALAWRNCKAQSAAPDRLAPRHPLSGELSVPSLPHQRYSAIGRPSGSPNSGQSTPVTSSKVVSEACWRSPDLDGPCPKDPALCLAQPRGKDRPTLAEGSQRTSNGALDFA